MTGIDAVAAAAPSEPNASLQVRLLGPPHVITAAGRRLALERRDAGLLAYLALEGETPRQRLVELLWPDVEPEAARNTLRQRLFQLKKRCGTELVRGQEMLALAPALVLDLRADGAAAPLLDGCDYSGCDAFLDWLAARRERLAGERRAALTDRAEQAEKEGRLAAALGFAEELIALDPLLEHGHRRLMRLHYLRGDLGAALAAFERCERTLEVELGAQPSQETRALLRTLEAGTAVPAAAPVRQPVPASVQRPPRLIGRERELAAMARIWAGDRSFLLLGEAGLGKTRLLQEMAGRTPGAVHVHARPGDAGIPYASLARLLRTLIERVPAVIEAAPRGELARVLPEIGEPAPGAREAQRPALQRALDSVIKAASGRDVAALLVDDLHHADDASLEMLSALGLADGAGQVRWGFSSRPTGDGAAARGLLERLVDAKRLEVIALDALDESRLAELIDSLGVTGLDGARLAPSLMRHTGGNPLFALETVKQMSLVGAPPEGLPRPASVGQLIEGRLRRLSPQATALARVAAVAGVDFSVDIAEAVVGAGALDLADAWQELEAAHILRGNAFAHDLVYEATLGSVPETIRRHLHRSIAQRLQTHGGLPARIALHFASAGLPALAAEHWLSSARSAQAALRFVEATEAFERAAYGFAEGGRIERAFDAAYAMRLASFEVDLAERSGRALDLLERFATTPEQRARAHNERAVTRLHQGDLPGTEQAALAGLRELGGADQPLLRAELRRNLAAIHAWRNETHAALSELRSIQHDVERLGSPQQRFELWESLAIVLDHVDESEESERTHRRAIDAAVEIGNLPGAAQTALNLAVCLHDAGRLQDALAAIERARGMLAAVQAERLSYSSLNLNCGFVLRGLGEYGGALEQLALAIENCRAQTPGWLPLAMAHRAQVFLQLGQFARAQQDLDAAVPDARSPITARCKWVAVRAALAHRLGRREVADIDEVIAALPAGGRRLTRWRLQRARLEHVDDAEAVRSGLGLLEEMIAAGRAALAISVGALVAPRLWALERADEARSLARRTLEQMRALAPDDAYRGDIWWPCCRVLQAEFDPELARVVAWLQDTASQRVPAEFRDSFLSRNPSNRELLRAASRRRGALR